MENLETAPSNKISLAWVGVLEMSEYADYVYKKYEVICENCGASNRKGSSKCWVCGKKFTPIV